MEKHTKSKLIKAAYENYVTSNNYSLRDVYSNFSPAKENAFNWCRDLCYNHFGAGLKIIGSNCMTFSAGFIGDAMNEKTGEIKDAFFWITKDNIRYIFIDEI